MAYPRKNTGALSNGFVCASKSDGTSIWMPTPPRASLISFSTKLKVNRRRAFFESGRLKSEIRRHAAIMGLFQAVPVEVQKLAVKNYALVFRLRFGHLCPRMDL